MSKLVLNDVTNLSGNESSAVATINGNSDILVAAFDNTFSRDGSSPNTINTDIDLNSNDILNGGRADFVELFIDGTDVHTIAGPMGPQGIPGLNGTNGTNGATWFTGTADPTLVTLDGNFYLQKGNGSTGILGDVWERLSGAWAKQVNIRGATGASGAGTGDMLASTYDAAGISQQVVGTVATQTLTNKTLTSPTINGATLTTPALGTPASGVLTNATGLPIGTGVSGLGTGIATFLATPSSANLATALTNEIGTAGFVVFSVSPTLTGTPLAPTATAGTNTTQIATTAFVLDALTRLTGLNTQTASYTLVLTDAGKLVEVNNASANNLTVPTNATVAFPLNTRIDLAQYGAGQTTIVAASGVTIRSNNGLKLTGQYAGGTLFKRGTDEWYLFGNTST